MGEYADMIIEGLLCQGCHELIDGGESGHPRYCSDKCAEEDGAEGSDIDDYAHPFDEIEADFEIIKRALKEYKKLSYTFACKNKCQKTNRGIKHANHCKANKHKELAKKALDKFNELDLL
jgi:hypothetical protein